MVKRHLLDLMIAKTVDARIADVSDIADALGERKNVARRAHVAERRIRFAAFADDVVRLKERVPKRFRRRKRRMLQIRLRRLGRREFTRKLARLVRPHAVGDHENMTARTPYAWRRRRMRRE